MIEGQNKSQGRRGKTLGFDFQRFPNFLSKSNNILLNMYYQW